MAFVFVSLIEDGLNHLPALVDERGNTASLETAMSGLDSYEHAKRMRRIGIVRFGVGVLLCAGAVITTSKRESSHVA